MPLPYEYSPAELFLMEKLGVMKDAQSPHLVPILIWHSMAMVCFRNNNRDVIEAAVRKGLLHLEKTAGACRGTPEFEAMITVDPIIH